MAPFSWRSKFTPTSEIGAGTISFQYKRTSTPLSSINRCIPPMRRSPWQHTGHFWVRQAATMISGKTRGLSWRSADWSSLGHASSDDKRHAVSRAESGMVRPRKHAWRPGSCKVGKRNEKVWKFLRLATMPDMSR